MTSISRAHSLVASPTQGARPGVRLRGLLEQAYAVRGHKTGKLWIQYSNKAGVDVAFSTEVAYLHFLYLESSFDVRRVDYAPALKLGRTIGTQLAEHVDAEIVMADGRTIWRLVCSGDQVDRARDVTRQIQLLLASISAPDDLCIPQLETLTYEEMLASPMRIRNWHAIAAWLAAGKDWALSEQQREVAAMIWSRGRAEFKDVLALGGGSDCADLFGVALFRSLQAGAYCTDLFDAPFTLRSTFARREDV